MCLCAWDCVYEKAALHSKSALGGSQTKNVLYQYVGLLHVHISWCVFVIKCNWSVNVLYRVINLLGIESRKTYLIATEKSPLFGWLRSFSRSSTTCCRWFPGLGRSVQVPSLVGKTGSKTLLSSTKKALKEELVADLLSHAAVPDSQALLVSKEMTEAFLEVPVGNNEGWTENVS